MNIINIFLIIGLVYFAFTQKSLKNRNILLVITGLITIYMFSIEGLDDIIYTEGKGSRKKYKELSEKLSVGGIITSNKNNILYTFPKDFDKDNGVPKYNCPEGKLKGNISRDNIKTLDASNIDQVYPCVSPQKCSESSEFKCDCGYEKKYKETDVCSGASCTKDDFNNDGPCCDDKPSFCDCLKTTDGKDNNCNSGWVRTQKYIKKNSKGDGWEFTSEYWDEDNYKCWDMLLGDLWKPLGIFAGKCVVPNDISQEELDSCDPPDPDPETKDNNN